MSKQKVFKFFTNKPNNLTDTIDIYCDVIQCGSDKFTLKRYKPVNGHDDTLPYSGDLYCNNIFICHCYNDGWGGITELTTNNSIVENLRLKTLRTKINKYKWHYGDNEFKLELDFIADNLALGLYYKGGQK